MDQTDGWLELIMATTAWIALAVHIAVAFGRLHDWSHGAAWRHTAERMQQWFGVYDGAGVWANYAVLFVWGADIATSWWAYSRKPFSERGLHRESKENSPRLSAPFLTFVTGGERPEPWQIAARLFVAFMQFQAAIVFGSPWLRMLGLGFVALWAIFAWNPLRRPRAPDR